MNESRKAMKIVYVVNKPFDGKSDSMSKTVESTGLERKVLPLLEVTEGKEEDEEQDEDEDELWTRKNVKTSFEIVINVTFKLHHLMELMLVKNRAPFSGSTLPLCIKESMNDLAALVF